MSGNPKNVSESSLEKTPLSELQTVLLSFHTKAYQQMSCLFLSEPLMHRIFPKSPGYSLDIPPVSLIFPKFMSAYQKVFLRLARHKLSSHLLPKPIASSYPPEGHYIAVEAFWSALIFLCTSRILVSFHRTRTLLEGRVLEEMQIPRFPRLGAIIIFQDCDDGISQRICCIWHCG